MSGNYSIFRCFVILLEVLMNYVILDNKKIDGLRVLWMKILGMMIIKSNGSYTIHVVMFLT